MRSKLQQNGFESLSYITNFIMSPTQAALQATSSPEKHNGKRILGGSVFFRNLRPIVGARQGRVAQQWSGKGPTQPRKAGHYRH